MPDTDHILRDILARLDTLEQRNTALHLRNDHLEQENRALRARVETRDRIESARPASIPASPTSSTDASVTRRMVLRRAAQMTAATVAAGVLMVRDDRAVDASHGTEDVTANKVSAHSAQVSSETGDIALYGYTVGNGSPAFPAFYGVNGGTGAGVHGESTGGHGVYGIGFAVDSAGVAGLNSVGDGVRGDGKTGLHGVSLNGNGIMGEGGTGYGGVFKGSRAQIRLTPTGRMGKPTTGRHQIGELYLDKVGSLYICTATGTPGTWKRVTVS